jgi:hypothetical protein
MDTEKKPELANKPLPPDAIVKGPNKKVLASKFLDDCAS